MRSVTVVRLAGIALAFFLCAVSTSAPIHPHASMAAQLRIHMQLQRQAIEQQRALVKMHQRAARQQMLLEKQMLRAQQKSIRQHLALQKRIARALAPKLSSKSRPLLHPSLARRTTVSHSHVARKIGTNPLRRSHPLPSALKKTQRLAMHNPLPRSSGSFPFRIPYASFPNTLSYPMLPPASLAQGSPMPGVGSIRAPLPSGELPAQPAPPIPDKLVAPLALAAPPSTEASPAMHKARAEPDDERDRRREDPRSFFADSIAPPSERLSQPESSKNGATQLVSALARHQSRFARTTATTIPLDLLRRFPPLPLLPTNHFVAPLMVVE